MKQAVPDTVAPRARARRRPTFWLVMRAATTTNHDRLRGKEHRGDPDRGLAKVREQALRQH